MRGNDGPASSARGRPRCNLSQGPSDFLFYQQPIGPHTKRPLGFHSDGGHFAPRHPINSSRAVCNVVVMFRDTIYPPRAKKGLRIPADQSFLKSRKQSDLFVR